MNLISNINTDYIFSKESFMFCSILTAYYTPKILRWWYGSPGEKMTELASHLSLSMYKNHEVNKNTSTILMEINAKFEEYSEICLSLNTIKDKIISDPVLKVMDEMKQDQNLALNAAYKSILAKYLDDTYDKQLKDLCDLIEHQDYLRTTCTMDIVKELSAFYLYDTISFCKTIKSFATGHNASELINDIGYSLSMDITSFPSDELYAIRDIARQTFDLVQIINEWWRRNW